MNIEYKPGVLCIIIRGATPKGKSNVGKTVELVAYLQPGDVYMESAHYGVRNADNMGAWLVKGDDIAEPLEPRREFGLYTQPSLMPIQDPDNDFVEDQKYKLVVTVDGHEVTDFAEDMQL